ncbi:MAG: hypothetical protein AVDCRST_MAG14-1096, partial [uncultured Rubrobacteraceae bacterium]
GRYLGASLRFELYRGRAVGRRARRYLSNGSTRDTGGGV